MVEEIRSCHTKYDVILLKIKKVKSDHMYVCMYVIWSNYDYSLIVVMTSAWILSYMYHQSRDIIKSNSI